jgi:hypothetical protein
LDKARAEGALVRAFFVTPEVLRGALGSDDTDRFRADVGFLLAAFALVAF